MPSAAKAVPAFDSEWLDDMVKKLKDELAVQLQRITDGKTKTSTAAARASDARTLAVLERTLERLAGMEQARALARETKIGKPNARDALERRLDKLAAPTDTKPDS